MVNLGNNSIKRWMVLLTVVVITLIPIIRYWSVFCCPIDISRYAQKYSQSQYILGEASPQKISDSELYVYAGYAYWQGDDPTTINFEHPPLAKYAYGLFYQLFGNPYYFNIPLYLGILLLFWQLSGIVLEKKWLRLTALIVLGSLSLIQVHMRYALLDLPLLFSYLLFFYGLLGSFKPAAKGLLLGLGLGIALTVKYPFPMVLLLLGFLAVDCHKNKYWLSAVIGMLTAGVIYLASYVQYFRFGHDLRDWLAFEKYRINWFMGKVDASRFLILQTLFTGSFKTWWDEQTQETTAHWSLLWPTMFIGAVFGWLKGVSNKNYHIFVLIGFSLLQLLVYGVGAAASDRFFITLLPFWILGSCYLIESSQLFQKKL